MVIISDCLSEDGSSILPRIAKLSQSMEVVYPLGLISQETQVRILPLQPNKLMIEYIVTFFAVFFTDVFYTYYLKAVQDEQVMRASSWAAIVFLIACVAVINYTTNQWLLVPAAVGAFCGTWVGMKIRKKQSSV